MLKSWGRASSVNVAVVANGIQLRPIGFGARRVIKRLAAIVAPFNSALVGCAILVGGQGRELAPSEKIPLQIIATPSYLTKLWRLGQ